MKQNHTGPEKTFGPQVEVTTSRIGRPAGPDDGDCLIEVGSEGHRLRAAALAVSLLWVFWLGAISAHAQGALTNGALHEGTILVDTTNSYTLTATNGDRVVLRAGALSGGGFFEPWLRVYGPDGTLVGEKDPSNIAAADVELTATNSGTFTVLVCDGSYGGYGYSGTYQLSYVKVPGTLAISPGDEGGPLTNGTLSAGTIGIGDLDAWSFTATNGDRVVLRAGALSGGGFFEPWLRVYGPDGTLVGEKDPSNIAAADVELTATNSGMFTVVVGDGDYGGIDYSGTYQLSYVKTPGTLVISPGDEGGPLTNGTLNAGTIGIGDLDAWSFTATNGDRVVLRAGALTGGSYFEPWLRVYGPDGTLVGEKDPSNIAAAEVPLTATNSGTFTVVVGDGGYAGIDYPGTYQLSYVKTPGALVISPGDEGGPLTNGTLNTGTIGVGDLDAWSFTATNGDRVVLRAGRLSGGIYFEPWLRVYGPDGTLVDSTDPGNVAAAEVVLTATNSGTFTVLVGDGSYAGIDYSGTYQLSFIKTPGGFFISPGDEGGPLTNGGNHDGTIDVGDLDAWSFTGTAGDNVVLRVGRLSGDTYFQPWLRLFNPAGELIDDTGSDTAVAAGELALALSDSGTYTVLVSDSSYSGIDDTGSYRLCYVELPGSWVIADDGGALTNSVASTGTILLGDLDLWQFQACRADGIHLQVDELSDTNVFDPYLRLYGPDGALIASQSGAASAQINLMVTNTGKFTLLVCDGNSSGFDGSGAYMLTGLGISSEGFRLCRPIPDGDNVNLAAMGGLSNATLIVWTHTNLSVSTALWTPVLTNQFDEHGLFDQSLPFDPAEPERFYLLEQQ